MTSARKIHQNNRIGFTILEIMISMAVLAIMIGSAALYLGNQNNSELSKIARETEILAKQTMRTAKLQARPYSVFISASKIWYQAENLQIESTPSSSILIPKDISVSVLRASDIDWFTITDNDDPYVWTFTQSGLCNSIEIKFEDDVGIETIKFDPLTASSVTDAD